MALPSGTYGLWQTVNYSGSGDFLDESGNSHDLTISGPTWDGTNKKFVFDGSNDAMTLADHADFDIAAGDSFTVMVCLSPLSGGPNTYQTVICKEAYAGGTGWVQYLYTAGPTLTSGVRDGGGSGDDSASYTADTKQTMALRRDVAGDNVYAVVNGSPGTPTTDGTTSTLENSSSLKIGTDFSDTYFTKMDLYAVAFWRRSLSDSELSDAHSALMNPVTTTTVYPASDIATTGWSASTGSDFYALVDEADTPNDSDYVYVT